MWVIANIVRFENVIVQSGAAIVAAINERFEATGTFNAPAGTTLAITP
jgi:hypothetical protein